MDDERKAELSPPSAPAAAAGASGQGMGAEIARREHAGSVPSASPSERLKPKDRRLWDLSFGVGKSRRYHLRRRRHFDTLDFMRKVAGAASGSAAALAVAGNLPYAAVAASGVIMAIVSAADLVLSFSARARLHEGLYRRYSELLAEIEGNAAPTEEDLAKWRALRLKIEGENPPVLTVLDDYCYNEEANARGCDPLLRIPLKGIQLALMDWCDVGPVERHPPPAAGAASTGA